MSSLTPRESRKLEDLFGMGFGFVMDFSNNTFACFFDESTVRYLGIEVDDALEMAEQTEV